MARQKSIIKLQGSIGDISFYKTTYGYLAREKTGLDGNRIATDPAFARTRENGMEFGSVASSGKLLREALRPMLIQTKRRGIIPRLVKLMAAVKNLDATSRRGERNVGAGITTTAAKALVKGFNFNEQCSLGAVFAKPYAVNKTTGVITIGSIEPATDIVFQPGATHVSLQGGWAKIDFVKNSYELQLSEVVSLGISEGADVILTPAAVPAGTGTDVFLLFIGFYQEVNEVQYPLRNGEYNVLSIIEVV
jgi:hypothetical protein